VQPGGPVQPERPPRAQQQRSWASRELPASGEEDHNESVMGAPEALASGALVGTSRFELREDAIPFI